MMYNFKTYGLVVLSAILLTLSLYALSLISTGERSVSRLETIHGIPYPAVDGGTHIDESLAHADIYLNQPVFAQALEVKVEFIPQNIHSLAVGVRENEFWLSYPRTLLYPQPEDIQRIAQTEDTVTAGFTIPLTDKLQEHDQSLDLMFFAEGENPSWQLVSLTAEVHHVWPAYPEFKDYARAILKRERAL